MPRSILETIRTQGRDRPWARSLIAAIAFHAMLIFGSAFLAWLMRGCIEEFKVPYGSGTPSVVQMRFVPKKEKKLKRILNPNSAISFDFPDLDDSKIQEELEEQSRDTYEADTDAVHGKMGEGGGDEGGWPDGMKDGKVRFARLKYDCSGWDDGMDSSTSADINFLDYFRNLPSVNFPVARQGEAYTMRQFMSLPKGVKPAFIYMTGSGSFRLSGDDIKRMREYIKEGGMIFADAGSARWADSFEALARRILPGHGLKVIADDDPLFARPFGFPNGPPPLWHHGGKQCKGVRFKGRWAVFYHPGDLNDAWKTGHSGMSRRLARESYRVGVNILWYSFTHYLAETREYRK
ncbi:MAG: DUF4159 domain-containing protein [Phycisphaerae bacterium]